MKTQNINEWLTKSEYARRVGLSAEAIGKAVRCGRLETNGKSGRECRVRGELSPSIKTPPNGKEESDKNLLQLKVEKLTADVALQNQKIEINIRTMKRECCAKLTEILRAAFAPAVSRMRASRPDGETEEAWNKALDDAQREIDLEVEKWLNE